MIQLIRTDTNEHLLSRVFDREYRPGSLFNLQEEIASYTAAAVAAPFGAVNRYNRRLMMRRGATIEAYESVLRFYDIQLRPTRNRARDLLKKVTEATDINPEFSSGWAIQSLMNTFLVAQCFPVADAEKHLAEAERCGRLAISLDGQNALGYFALYQTYYHRREFEDATRMIRRAMALNPNDYSILAYHSVCLALRGDNDAAMAMQTAALRLIGRAPPWFYAGQMIVDFRRGDYESVIVCLGDDPLNVPSAFQVFGLSSLVYLGRTDEAHRLLLELQAESGDYLVEAGRSMRQWHLSDDLKEKLRTSATIAGIDMDALAAKF